MKLYLGIDIGGTAIKGILINKNGDLLKTSETETGVQFGSGAIVDNIVKLINFLRYGVDEKHIVGVGVGCPGMINSGKGEVFFAGNLNLSKFPLASEIESRVNLPVKISNDAHLAALGESKFGASMEYENSILVTLGTGVGGGIIINGKLYEGHNSVGGEIGHMVIDRFGEYCTCGRRGCFERYGSAGALTRYTKKVMEENPGSKMWHGYTSDTATAKTPFDYMDEDTAAKEIIDWYVQHLAIGLGNLANIFRPDVIILGGGVCKQGDRLLVPVQEKLNAEIFAGSEVPVKVIVAKLENQAGAYGACALWM